MSESAHNPRVQAKKRGELPPRTAAETRQHYAALVEEKYFKYLASKISSADHFKKIMADVAPRMAFEVKRKIMKHLPAHVVEDLLQETEQEPRLIDTRGRPIHSGSRPWLPDRYYTTDRR